MLRFLICFLLVAAPVRAQVVQAQAGASSLFNATGGSVNLFFPNSELSFGVGVSGGKLVAGASDQFDFHSWEVTAGDRQLFFSGEGTGLTLATRGLYAQRKRKHDKLALFASSCGQTYSAPYFAGLRTNRACFGYDYHRAILPALEFDSFAVYEGRITAIESARWHWRRIVLAGSGGALNSSVFLNGSAAVQLPHFSATAQRQTTIFDGETFNTTSFSAASTVSVFQFHIAEFMSRVSGQNAGAGVQIGMFTVREDYYHANTSALSTTLIAKLNRRLQLTGSANDSQGRWSASYGGTFTSNLATITASNSLQYTPLRGFVKVFSAGIALQLPHSTSLNASTVTLPNGQVKFTAFAGSYAQGPYAGAAQNTVQHSHNAGKYVVRACVRDTDELGVEGAALEVAGELAVTDSSGCLFVRERKPNAVAIRVALEAFTVPGTFEVIEAPASAAPDQEAKIVVRRK